MTVPLSNSATLEPGASSPPPPSVSQAASNLRAAAVGKAHEIAHRVSTQASALKERAIESAHHFREVASEKVGQLKATAAETAGAIKHTTADRAHRLQETAAEQWRDTRVVTKEVRITAEDYICQNPTKCVVGAFGFGMLIGLLVRR